MLVYSYTISNLIAPASRCEPRPQRLGSKLCDHIEQYKLFSQVCNIKNTYYNNYWLLKLNAQSKNNIPYLQPIITLYDCVSCLTLHKVMAVMHPSMFSSPSSECVSSQVQGGVHNQPAVVHQHSAFTCAKIPFREDERKGEPSVCGPYTAGLCVCIPLDVHTTSLAAFSIFVLHQYPTIALKFPQTYNYLAAIMMYQCTHTPLLCRLN